MVGAIFLFIFCYMVNTQDLLKNKVKTPNYECLNGKDPNTLSLKENLLEFSKGPCSPFIIMPGTFSSVLTVEVDCPTLQRDNPEVFKTCGWNTCNKHWYEFWKKMPSKEYRLWIPEVFSPLNIFTINDTSNFCFAKFFKTDIDVTKPVEQAFIPPVGFKIKNYGGTPESKGKSECGNHSISDLIGSIEIGETRVFDNLFKSVSDMGYTPGLTYQSIPYDFRRSYRANGVETLFKTNITKLRRMTGKKVIIMSHSLGGVNTYHQLLKHDRAFKEDSIKNWINIAAPILGASRALMDLLSGYSDLIFIKNLIGLHLDAAIEAISDSFAIHELLPFDAFTAYEGQPWFERVKKRIAYEKGEVDYKDSGFNFLPKADERCAVDKFKENTECKFNFYDQSKNSSVKIMGEEFKLSEMEKLLTKWNITDKTLDIYNLSRDPALNTLNNPEIPIIFIFLRSLNTGVQFNYKEDIKEWIKKDEFYQPDVLNSNGDGTVEANSYLLPALKWITEFEDKKDGAKPMKLIEICSTYNMKGNLYDSQNEAGERVFDTVDYRGVNCECENEENAGSCNHQHIPNDTAVIPVFLDIFRSNSVSYSPEYESYVNSLDNDYLDIITTECPQIFDYNIFIELSELTTIEI